MVMDGQGGGIGGTIIKGLREMAASDPTKFTSITRAYMGKQIARFLETFPLQGKV